MATEFSDIWIYNLRGNQRTAGELFRQEGGKVFGAGARTGVAVLIAVKRASGANSCSLHYYEVPDYQTREQKLTDLEHASVANMSWRTLTPNHAGDWLNQRTDAFAALTPLIETTNPARSLVRSTIVGPVTARDSWVYSFSAAALAHRLPEMIDFYNAQVLRARGDQTVLDMDPRRISWSRG